MAGAFLEIRADDRQVLQVLSELTDKLNDLTPAFRDIGEALLLSHRERWQQQVNPEGDPWEPLSDAYKASKKKNQDKLLVLDGYLQMLHYQAGPEGLALGTDRVYGAIHQFGGDIQHAARPHTVYFKQDKAGNVGSRFVRKKHSNFAQDVTVGEHTTHMPARPFLGLSESDKATVLEILGGYLR